MEDKFCHPQMTYSCLRPIQACSELYYSKISPTQPETLIENFIDFALLGGPRASSLRSRSRDWSVISVEMAHISRTWSVAVEDAVNALEADQDDRSYSDNDRMNAFRTVASISNDVNFHPHQSFG